MLLAAAAWRRVVPAAPPQRLARHGDGPSRNALTASPGRPSVRAGEFGVQPWPVTGWGRCSRSTQGRRWGSVGEEERSRSRPRGPVTDPVDSDPPHISAVSHKNRTVGMQPSPARRFQGESGASPASPTMAAGSPPSTGISGRGRIGTGSIQGARGSSGSSARVLLSGRLIDRHYASQEKWPRTWRRVGNRVNADLARCAVARDPHGRGTTKVKAGGHVVVPSFLGCGTCWYCDHDLYLQVREHAPKPVRAGGRRPGHRDRPPPDSAPMSCRWNSSAHFLDDR